MPQINFFSYIPQIVPQIILKFCMGDFNEDLSKIPTFSHINPWSGVHNAINVFLHASYKLLATGWTTKGSEFESRSGQEISLLHVVQNASRAHPASYPVGTGGSFPGV
jgi:hypothetical protein